MGSATNKFSHLARLYLRIAKVGLARRGYAEFLLAPEQQVQTLREASRRVLKRYEVSYSSSFEVVDADRDLFNAELQLAQAYRDTRVSLVQLYKAPGGGWDGAATGAPADPRVCSPPEIFGSAAPCGVTNSLIDLPCNL